MKPEINSEPEKFWRRDWHPLDMSSIFNWGKALSGKLRFSCEVSCI